MSLIIPEKYTSVMDIRATEVAIKLIKDYFEQELSRALNLTRVSAPLFVDPTSGLNDNLNGVERPVSFDVKETGQVVEIVHSLAKWKRFALARYGFAPGEGIYTDMNAIRRDEETDNLHSIYVDQWDWERVIAKEDRNVDTLKTIVNAIYTVLKNTEKHLAVRYPFLKPVLPEKIHFVTTQELEFDYPDFSPKERETAACRKYGAVFLMKIGGKLESGKIHDGRAPDYDDWTLNGDIIVDYPLLGSAFELSSMGIRVDKDALISQLAERGCPERAELPFQKALISGELPLTIGGGIGQSRICMFFLRRAHIGEVQSSLWPENMIKTCADAGIKLL